MKFGIVVKAGHTKGEELTAKVRPYLKSKGHEVLAEKDFKGADYILTFGGDGTLIHVACEYAYLDVPFIGFNTGRLGFLTACEAAEWQRCIDELIANHAIISERMTLGAIVSGKKDEYQAVNEAVIKGLYRVIDLEIKVSGQAFLKIAGDGVIISTPTGSTAYSLSAGGPIVDSQLNCILITPVNPIGLPIPSVVISPNDVIDIKVLDGDDVSLIIDGQEHTKLKEGSKIKIYRGKHNIKFGYLEKHSFIRSLNAKFGLSGRTSN